MKNVKIAKQVLRIEAQAIERLIGRLDGNFESAIEMLHGCRGRVVVTGMGKPGIIGRKISATLASTGTPSVFLHPAEAVHGDLGMVVSDDVVLALSNSGETEELTRLLPLLKKLGSKLISVTGNPKSTLARHSDVVMDVSVEKEACTLNLAPTASTTAMLAMGDALAVALLERRGFKEKDFAFYHPGGKLGRKFTLVKEVMRTGGRHPVLPEQTRVREVLLKITAARAGCATLIGKNGKLAGIFTDGDLRRWLAKDASILEKPVAGCMTRDPITIRDEALLAEGLRIIQQNKIDEIVVVDKNNRPVGLLDEKDLLELQ